MIRVLAENAGMDPIDTQVQLRTKITNSNKPKYGIDVINKKIADMIAASKSQTPPGPPSGGMGGG
jgi:chaperonin GroEL (HSP60 family)